MSKSLVFIILFCFLSLSVSADLICYWGFDVGAPDSGNWNQPITSNIGSGSLTYSFDQVRRAPGTETDRCITETNNYSLSIISSTTHNNKYIEFIVSTDGYKDIIISFMNYRSANTFRNYTLSYSTDGSSFTPFPTFANTTTNWSRITYDLSSNELIDDQSNVWFRVALSNYVSIDNLSRIDNIQINADPNTLPVEFSGMTVNPGTDNNAYITWTTQSETGVNGFYVLRGCSDLLSEAAIISPLIPAANTSTTQTYFFADDDLPASGFYFYWLQSLDFNGEISYFGSQTLVWSPGDPSNPSAPLKTGLSTLYPNPFNPSLTIAYSLDEPAPAQIKIYNLRGQAVHSLDMGRQIAGEHKFVWNGTSDRGEACPSGVYRVVLHAGNVIDTRKVLLLK